MFWRCLYALEWTLKAMRPLPRSQSIDSIKGLRFSQKWRNSRNIIKRLICKESKTDMESATFETSMTVVAIAIEIVGGYRNRQNATRIQNLKKSTSQNQVLETCISMKTGIDCNGITPAT